MKTVIFMLEERSAQVMLEGFIPQLGLEATDIKYIVFEGKQDLDQNIERKLRGWLAPDTCFVILRDQDSGDCIGIKQSLIGKAKAAGRRNVLVRIACHELESWYLGHLAAVEAGLGIPGLSRLQQKKKYRTPDEIIKPSHELQRLTKDRYQKISGSRQIGRYLEPDQNQSQSFGIFVSGLKRLFTSRT